MTPKATSFQVPCTTAPGLRTKHWSNGWLRAISSNIIVFTLIFASRFDATAGQKDVLTYHNNNARTGATLHEDILTPANVNTNTFGKLWVLNTDGKVMAEPLYASDVAIPGKGVHNVVFVATEHNTVYAFDAESTNILWQVSMNVGNERTVTNWDWCSFGPEIGITATPVIDRTLGPNGTIFVEAMSVDAATNVYQRLHALDLSTGLDRVPPVEVHATYPGTGDFSSNGNVIFDPNMYIERACLLLLNDVVYTAWSAHCDTRPVTSWVIGFDKYTLARTNILNLEPNGDTGSIWNSGAGPAADANGNIYVTLGNGRFDTSYDANGFPINGDYGSCFVKISTSNNVLHTADYFAVSNIQQQIQQDLDLSSGSPLVIPDLTDAQGNIRQLVVTSGKDETIYLADQNNMGKFHPNTNAIYQQVPYVLTNGTWSMAAYFNSTLYFGPVKSPVMAFPLVNARVAPMSSHSKTNFGYPGSTPSISANGTANGIVWCAETVGIVIEDQTASKNAVLHAFAATNLAVELYNSSQRKNAVDTFGKGNKFITPMIANGRVYCATTTGIGVFGLLVGPPTITSQPASQTVNPNGVAAFNVGVTSSISFVYQWQFNGVAIPNATDSSYTITNVTAQDAGSYAVVLTSDVGSVTSSNAVLFVNQPPTITGQPQTQTISLGTPATFVASVDGTAPLYFQWQFNGTNIANATDSSYTIPSTQFQNAGSYSVIVTNMAGAVTSAAATLVVHPCMPIYVVAVSNDLSGGVSITWTTDAGILYAVEYKNDLADAQWTTLLSTNAPGATMTFAEQMVGMQRFYRLETACTASEPAGYIVLNAPANSDTVFSVPFVRPLAAAGMVGSVSGNTIAVSQQYPSVWNNNQFVYSVGTQAQNYYVRFTSGGAQGSVYSVTANDASSISVDNSANPLSTVSAGDKFVIEPYWSLNSIFPNGAGVNASPTVGNRNTELLVPDTASAGINLSATKVYFFNGVWKQVGDANTDHGDDVVPQNSYLIVRHNVATNTAILTMGIADTSPWIIPMRLPDGSATKQQDNHVALARAVAVSLDASGLVSSGAFAPSPLPGSRRDELLVFDNAAAAKNKSAADVYYYWNSNWRRVGSGSADVGTNKVFTPGTGVIIRKSTNASSSNWVNSSTY